MTLPIYEPAVRQICGVDFVFPEYKEPLVQLKGAVKGYMRGTLPYALADGRLPCAFCDPSVPIHRVRGSHGYRRDNLFDYLTVHVRRHGMSPQEYRDAIGLLRSTKLMSRRARLILSGALLQSGRMGAGDASPMHTPESVARQAASKRGLSENAEHQNKRGVCHAQILAVARGLAKDNGGVLRSADLIRQGIQIPTLHHAGFSSVRALAVGVGARRPEAWNRWTDADLLRAFRELAERLGRTPTQKELGGANGTASGSAYFTHFGGLEEVCRRLGLPSNSSRPVTLGDEIDILNHYATTGRISRVIQATHRSQDHVTQILDKFGVLTYRGSGHEAERRKAREWAAEIARRLAGTEEMTA